MKTLGLRTSRATRALAGLMGSMLLSGAAGPITGLVAQAQTPKLDAIFGPNVTIIDPSMTESQIEAKLTAISNEAQFSTNRHAVLFMPGTYTVEAPVGYYEQIAGLGATPGSVTINGFITPNFGVPVYNTPSWPQANLTDIFWRSLENMTFNVATDSLQNAAPNTLQWGVSQAAPLRRLQINGSLELTNSSCGNASGGFISDIVVTGSVNPCSQQQWFSRNSSFGSWNGGVWNMVFSGVQGAPAQTYPNPPETVVADTPVSREKPYLYLNSKGVYHVFAPAVKRNATGTTWSTGASAGRSLPLTSFFVVYPSTPVAEMNLALVEGKNLLITPGVYPLSEPIYVGNPDTVVLGMGYATLVPQNGTAALTVADVPGVQIAGLIVDAGPLNSPMLVQVGDAVSNANHAANPTAISDLTVRIGGATAGSAADSIVVNSNDVILDDIWAWRADHGAGAGWTTNPAAHGLVVNGTRVTALGLAVEHYQQEQVLWNGNGGETIFYQSELPYDVPNQSAWMDGTANGYPSYVVADSVKTHTAYGLGIYSFFDLGLAIVEDNAMTVPVANGVQIHDAGTVFLNGSGQITHVINGEGGTVTNAFADRLSPVVTYP